MKPKNRYAENWYCYIAKDYISLDKSNIRGDDQDNTARMFLMGKTHKAIMGTAGVNIGVAAAIEGTIPNLIKRKAQTL